MKEQREVKENYLVQHLPWLLNNAHFCYNRESPTNNDNEEKQHFLQHEKNIKIPKQLTQMGQTAFEVRQAMQWYLQILLEEGLYLKKPPFTQTK